MEPHEAYDMIGIVMNSVQSQPVGSLLRAWRQRRRLSQFDLALESGVSTRHLSFLETGRALPSRDMLLHLAEQLDIPLRERNVLLTAAGYAQVFPERSLDDPTLEAARRAVDLVLAGHEPHPALAIDRHWTLIAANHAVQVFQVGVDSSLLQPPVNVLRLSLHPSGLAPRLANFHQWRAHVLARLRHQVEITADPLLTELISEISSYLSPKESGASQPATQGGYTNVAVPFQLITDDGLLVFYSTTTMFGTPVDITVSELAIESFFPADEATAQAMRRFAEGQDQKRLFATRSGGI